MKERKEQISDFTIFVPIIHPLENLKRCMSSLDGLDYPRERFQVVFVDCREVEGVEEFLKENLPEHGFRAVTLSLGARPSTGLPHWLTEGRLNEARNYTVENVPGRCYVFTEDDCTFEVDWLKKIEGALGDGVGAVGGPDLLPSGLGWLPRVIDCVLNSYLGTAGTRRGDGRRKDRFHLRKENMAVPAWVFERVGKFPEKKQLGGEMSLTQLIRKAGLKVLYLPENPVWHRRVTKFSTFFRLTAYMAYEKVRLMREMRTFIPSPHFVVLLAAISGPLIILFSLVNSYARLFIVATACAYLVALIACAVSSALSTRSVSVGLGIFLLIPAHHLGITFGTTKGAFSRIKPDRV
jgi:GT2 family glycosyltransferase